MNAFLKIKGVFSKNTYHRYDSPPTPHKIPFLRRREPMAETPKLGMLNDKTVHHRVTLPNFTRYTKITQHVTSLTYQSNAILVGAFNIGGASYVMGEVMARLAGMPIGNTMSSFGLLLLGGWMGLKGLSIAGLLGMELLPPVVSALGRACRFSTPAPPPPLVEQPDRGAHLREFVRQHTTSLPPVMQYISTYQEKNKTPEIMYWLRNLTYWGDRTLVRTNSGSPDGTPASIEKDHMEYVLRSGSSENWPRMLNLPQDVPHIGMERVYRMYGGVERGVNIRYLEQPARDPTNAKAGSLNTCNEGAACLRPQWHLPLTPQERAEIEEIMGRIAGQTSHLGGSNVAGLQEMLCRPAVYMLEVALVEQVLGNLVDAGHVPPGERDALVAILDVARGRMAHSIIPDDTVIVQGDADSYPNMIMHPHLQQRILSRGVDPNRSLGAYAYEILDDMLFSLLFIDMNNPGDPDTASELRALRSMFWLLYAEIFAYDRTLGVVRPWWAELENPIMLSGAFTVTRFRMLLEVMGWDRGNQGEDFALFAWKVLHLMDRPYDAPVLTPDYERVLASPLTSMQREDYVAMGGHIPLDNAIRYQSVWTMLPPEPEEGGSTRTTLEVPRQEYHHVFPLSSLVNRCIRVPPQIIRDQIYTAYKFFSQSGSPRALEPVDFVSPPRADIFNVHIPNFFYEAGRVLPPGLARLVNPDCWTVHTRVVRDSKGVEREETYATSSRYPRQRFCVSPEGRVLDVQGHPEPVRSEVLVWVKGGNLRFYDVRSQQEVFVGLEGLINCEGNLVWEGVWDLSNPPSIAYVYNKDDPRKGTPIDETACRNISYCDIGEGFLVNSMFQGPKRTRVEIGTDGSVTLYEGLGTQHHKRLVGPGPTRQVYVVGDDRIVILTPATGDYLEVMVHAD